VTLGKTSKRTLLLAITAAATFVWCGIRYFDIPPATMLGFFVASVAVLFICIFVAFLLVFLLRLIKGRSH
jgi:phosphotransferase system  glucose/maltose/N-acetylglucosamine-specific IIC component